MHAISVVVLAGGASRRMGTNKALLRIDNGDTLIARVVSNMAALSDDLVVVSNAPELYADLPVRHAGDMYPGKGPLAGLHAGLSAARHPWSFVTACDMPLIDRRLVRYMVLLSAGHQAVVPRVDGQPEPLHALYSKEALPAIEQRLEVDDLRVVSFYPTIQVRYVEPHEWAIFDPERRSFANANTPEDWDRLRSLLRAESD